MGAERLSRNWRRISDLRNSIHPTGKGDLSCRERGIAALVNPERLRRILTRMLDENEFLSSYGIRAPSRYHADHPYVFNVNGEDYRVNYLPAESDSRILAETPAGVVRHGCSQCAADSRVAAVLPL
jgi:hypothetical protein